MSTIAVIGGGAAGMMAAATILEQKNFAGKVLLFERNKRLGAKVIISGGGRCNVTTGIHKRQELKTYYTRGGDFLDAAFRAFGPRQVRKRFETYGVPLKEEDDQRVFPVSDDGKDIVAVFEKMFAADDRVDVLFGAAIHTLEPNTGEGFELHTVSTSYTVDKVILATGGNAYAHTGSRGDGYAFARACGHEITDLGPSLNSFKTTQQRLHTLSGMSFQDAHIAIVGAQGDQAIARGPVLLTHFGISGPAVFVVASYTAFRTIDVKHPLLLKLRVMADKDTAYWEERLLEQISISPKKTIQNMLSRELPKRFVLAILAELAIQTYQQASTLTRQQRLALSTLLGEGIPLSCIQRRPGDEFVTAGGVSLDDINSQTMHSSICPGLYFAGEVMDVDGVTGGFNLQASRAAGRVAGLSSSA